MRGCSRMKIVLVNPPSPAEFRVSRGLMGGFGMAVNPELLYPPIELAHVAGVLEEDGHEVFIIDADALGLGPAGALERVRALDARLDAVETGLAVFLDTDTGLSGIAMGGARDMIHTLVDGLLVGRDPRGVLGHWNAMVDFVFKSGNRGANTAAIASIASLVISCSATAATSPSYG